MELDQIINDVTAVQTALTQLQSDLQLLANTPTSDFSNSWWNADYFN